MILGEEPSSIIDFDVWDRESRQKLPHFLGWPSKLGQPKPLGNFIECEEFSTSRERLRHSASTTVEICLSGLI